MYRVPAIAIDDDTFISSTVGEGTAWASGGTYAIGNQRSRPNHRLYECTAAVTGSTTPPESDPTHWLDIGATDQRRPFDYYYGRRVTVNNDSWVIEPGLGVDALLIDDTDIESVRVLVELDGDVLQDDTIDMRVTDSANDYWTWIIAVPEPLLQCAVELDGMPGATITLTFNGTGELGKALIGKADSWGISTWSTGLTFRDMSQVNEDAFGIKSVTPRRGFFDINFRVSIPPDDVKRVKRLVRDSAGVVAGWLATRDAIYGAMGIGISRSFDLDYGSPGGSDYTVSVRSTV